MTGVIGLCTLDRVRKNVLIQCMFGICDLESQQARQELKLRQVLPTEVWNVHTLYFTYFNFKWHNDVFSI